MKLNNLLNLWTIIDLYNAFAEIERTCLSVNATNLFKYLILDDNELCDAIIYIKDNNEYFKLSELSYNQFRTIFERVKNHLGFEENDFLCDVEEVFDWRGL